MPGLGQTDPFRKQANVQDLTGQCFASLPIRPGCEAEPACLLGLYSINPPQRAVSAADLSVPGGGQRQLGQLGQERGGRLDAPDQHHEFLRQARLDGAAERPGRPREAGQVEQAAALLLLSDQ